MKSLRQYIACCFLLLVGILPASAVTRHVPAEFTTIQAALNASASGDTVLVQPDTYFENITWPTVDGVLLVAAGDSSNTIIDGGGTNRVITMIDAGFPQQPAFISGFTLRNGGNVERGGGMYCENAYLIIETCAFLSNEAAWQGYGTAGALFGNHSDLNVTDCRFAFNHAYHHAGAIWLTNSPTTFTACQITDNTCGVDGGGIFTVNSPVEIEDCDIQYNDHEGVFFTQDSNVQLSNSRLIGNDSNGVRCSCNDVVITGCTISQNGDTGVNCGNYDPIIIDCEISENTAPDNGGGLRAYASSQPQVYGTIFYHNSAPEFGGGIYCGPGSSITLANCILIDNTASSGGGIYATSATSVELDSCRVVGNSATGTGDLGGGVQCYYSNAIIHYSVIAGNFADKAGGLEFWECSSLIDHCVIDGNTGNLYAGGIRCGTGSLVQIVNSTITNNIGTGIYVYGGNNPDLTYSDLHDNSSGDVGGVEIDPDLGALVATNANGDSCDVYNNIFLDPLYADAPNSDYQVQEGSPCIDAGDPGGPDDPDGTTADIGVFYFDQGEIPDPVTFMVIPTSSTVIPPEGGTLTFDITLVSRLQQTVPNVWYTTRVMLPSGSIYAEVLHEFRFDLRPGDSLSTSLSQPIPAAAPTGNYQLIGIVSQNRGGTGRRAMDSFGFQKQ